MSKIITEPNAGVVDSGINHDDTSNRKIWVIDTGDMSSEQVASAIVRIKHDIDSTEVSPLTTNY
jgi:dTDP-glucose pyrophosphorylase